MLKHAKYLFFQTVLTEVKYSCFVGWLLRPCAWLSHYLQSFGHQPIFLCLLSQDNDVSICTIPHTRGDYGHMGDFIQKLNQFGASDEPIRGRLSKNFSLSSPLLSILFHHVNINPLSIITWYKYHLFPSILQPVHKKMFNHNKQNPAPVQVECTADQPPQSVIHNESTPPPG